MRKSRRHPGAAGGFSGSRFKRGRAGNLKGLDFKFDPSESLAWGVAGVLGGLVARVALEESWVHSTIEQRANREIAFSAGGFWACEPEIQFWIYGQKTGTSEPETTWKNLYSKPIIRGNHKAGREAVRVLLLAGMREAADLLRTIKVAGYSGRVRVWV